MISKDDILTIYSDCRGILLLQDEENPEMLVDTLVADYLDLSDINLKKIATEVGFRDCARFLRASEYFHVFKKGEQILIRLAETKNGEAKKKTPFAKHNENSLPVTHKSKELPKETPSIDVEEQMDVDPTPAEIANDQNNNNKASNSKPTDVIIIDDEEQAVVPQFVVQISDDPRYEKALQEHERVATKHPKDLEMKDLRYLINARKALYTKSWKNDMFMKLYPEEVENQEKLLAEKYRQSMIRSYELQK
ncbi:uncharacterized protein LOC134837748 [Culicoides brevitarsis]|uniref:uncharacterized protein LOC134837748 n=1 Tax=Culicoides brevitarsis TaxID=469753 RepID=UPI00307C7561